MNTWKHSCFSPSNLFLHIPASLLQRLVWSRVQVALPPLLFSVSSHVVPTGRGLVLFPLYGQHRHRGRFVPASLVDVDLPPRMVPTTKLVQESLRDHFPRMNSLSASWAGRPPALEAGRPKRYEGEFDYTLFSISRSAPGLPSRFRIPPG